MYKSYNYFGDKKGLATLSSYQSLVFFSRQQQLRVHSPVVDANIVNQAGEEAGRVKFFAGTNVLVRQQKRAVSFILTALQFYDTNCTLCPVFSQLCCRLSPPTWFVTTVLVVHCCCSNREKSSRNHRPVFCRWSSIYHPALH